MWSCPPLVVPKSTLFALFKLLQYQQQVLDGAMLQNANRTLLSKSVHKWHMWRAACHGIVSRSFLSEDCTCSLLKECSRTDMKLLYGNALLYTLCLVGDLFTPGTHMRWGCRSRICTPCVAEQGAEPVKEVWRQQGWRTAPRLTHCGNSVEIPCGWVTWVTDCTWDQEAFVWLRGTAWAEMLGCTPVPVVMLGASVGGQ